MGFRQALAAKYHPVPPHVKHRILHNYDPLLYRQRHKIENMFDRLRDWRRIHTRYGLDALTPSFPQSPPQLSYSESMSPDPSRDAQSEKS
jgi:transposase